MAGDEYDPAAASHRALQAIETALSRHPSVVATERFPEAVSTQIVARLDVDAFTAASGDPTLTVRWFAGETQAAEPTVSFHYSDRATDFGWHYEPNPHVDGRGHFQRADESADGYAYQPYSFASLEPARVVWEVCSQLAAELE
jgi:hypothetical protein